MIWLEIQVYLSHYLPSYKDTTLYPNVLLDIETVTDIFLQNIY